MPKGKKECKRCGFVTGVRSYNCPSCDYAFKMKKFQKTRKPKIVKNWRDLEAGDTIKVVGGSGPYYESEDGEKKYLTSRGVYYIIGVMEEGLSVQSKNCGSREYLYMGRDCVSPICDNLHRSSHKLLLVSKNKNTSLDK